MKTYSPKIMFLHLCGPFKEGLSYRENILPKYMARFASELMIVTTFDDINLHTNKIVRTKESKVYKFNSNEVKNISIIRLDYTLKFLPHMVYSRMRLFSLLYKNINLFKPDLIYINSLQFFDIVSVVKYKKKNPNVVIIGEINSTSNNSANNFFTKFVLHGFFYKYLIQYSSLYLDHVFYGSSAALEFTKMYYNSRAVGEILPLGFDDEKIEAVKSLDKLSLKKEFNIPPDEFIITTGGKLDADKKIIELLRSFSLLNKPNVRLIIFGSITSELEDAFYSHITSNQNITFLGWIDTDKIYRVIRMSNLVIFPGSHSALWESVVGIGTPVFIQKWTGRDYIDGFQNVQYLYEHGNVSEIVKQINSFLKESIEIDTQKNLNEKNTNYSLSYGYIASRILAKYVESIKTTIN